MKSAPILLAIFAAPPAAAATLGITVADGRGDESLPAPFTVPLRILRPRPAPT